MFLFRIIDDTHMNYKAFLLKCTILIFHGLIFIPSILTQDVGSLSLNENKLEGTCSSPYYTAFEIEMPHDYTVLDSNAFYEQFPRVGKILFKNKVEIPTEYTITNRAGHPQIMFRFRNNYITFDSLIFENQVVRFLVDDDPVVPVTEDDLQIIQLAKSMLSEEKYWNENGGRNCSDDLGNKSYSIYCAIKIASLEVENHYNHRNAALQKLRHLIELKFPDRKWNHRLMDFNNMDEVEYSDIVYILDEIENDFIEELQINR